MAYIHDAMIRAWLDGKDIQNWDDIDGWVDVRSVNADKVMMPSFYPAHKYRIKPTKVKGWVNMYQKGDMKWMSNTVYSSKERAACNKDILLSDCNTQQIEIEYEVV